MASLEEVNALLDVKHGEVVQEEPVSSEEQAFFDMQESLDLLRQTRTLLQYLSDPELCRTITMKERKAMIALATKVHGFVDNVEDSYEGGPVT